MKAQAAKHPRFGYRRVAALLRAEQWDVNDKRVHRLWRREGLKVPVRQRRRRRLGHSANSCTRRRAERRNQVWTYDFVHDRYAYPLVTLFWRPGAYLLRTELGDGVDHSVQITLTPHR